MEQSYGAFFSPHAWRTCAPASLRGHLVNDHLQILTLNQIGIARFDIEMASVRGFDLQWVVKKAMEKLERTDLAIQCEGADYGMPTTFTPQQYRQKICKNLLYIAQLELAHVDWQKVEKCYPNRPHKLDLAIDSRDSSFSSYLAMLEELLPK